MPKVAIIGAGPSGLTSAVAALNEGLEPTIFEMSYRIGGVWGPDTGDQEKLCGAWPDMKVNISRHTGTFSDFPWPQNADDFPTTQEVHGYLSDYTTYHKLQPYIKLNSKITKVTAIDKKWSVQWQENGTTIKEELFDSVIAAASKFSNPYVPEFKGLDTIKEKMLHSSKYKRAEAFKNKKILVVGGSLSGTSIAEELAKLAQVTHLMRRPRWIIKRYRSIDPQNSGPLLPRDLLKTYANAAIKRSAQEQYDFMLQHCSEQNQIPEWCMHPDSPPGFVVADEYVDLVLSGQLTPIQGEIDYFTESQVILQNSRCIDFDFVILCTGYERALRFLPDNLNKAPPILYEDTFPPDVENIAFIGLYPGARGAVFPLVELQAKWACAVLSGTCQLPSPEIMMKEITTTSNSRDEVEFTTSLASKLGVLPDFNSYDSNLSDILKYGAYTPARFLLEGRYSKPQLAIKMIKETESYRQRLLNPLDKAISFVNQSFFKLEEKQTKKTNCEESLLNQPH